MAYDSTANFIVLSSLVGKEIRVLSRNRHLLFLLLFPTTVQLIILGAALDPGVHNLQVGVIDQCNSAASRDLVRALGAARVFKPVNLTPDLPMGLHELEKSTYSALLRIPPDYSRNLDLEHKADVQVFLDATDTRVANICAAYFKRTILSIGQLAPPVVQVKSHFLFNPGLRSSWYFVSGVLGCLLTLTGTLVSSATLLRERERGTLAQLFMLPAEPWQVLLSKVVPIVCLMMIDVALALGIASLIFQLPFTGDIVPFIVSSILFTASAVALGAILANLARRQREAQLTSFFINIPVILLSGAIIPLETMPPFFQWLSRGDPLRYYQEITRDCMLRGAGWTEIMPAFTSLCVCVSVAWFLSLLLFRRQVG